MAASAYEAAPVGGRPRIGKTPSGNPLPRRGQVKERIAKDIAAALACGDRTVTGAGSGRKAGAGKPPAAAPGGTKK